MGHSEHSQLPAATTPPRRRALWPIAPALLLASGVASTFFVDAYDASVGVLLATTALPIAIAIVVAAVNVGGRRGRVVAAALTLLALYWVWFFGWELSGDISRFSPGLAAQGLSDAASYELMLAVYLWPFLALVIVVVAVVAWRTHRRIWPTLGVLTLLVILLSFPVGGGWDDGCNGHGGATPLLTRPLLRPLMDHGIGVLPNASSTLVGCQSTGDREWKPFWLGDDQLPPKPAIYGRIAEAIHTPTRLYRDPTPFVGRSLGTVELIYWPGRDDLTAIVMSRRKLPTGPPNAWPPVELEIDGRRFDDDQGLGVRGKRGWCYGAVWVGTLPHPKAGDELRVDFMFRGRRLATGRGRVQILTTDDANRRAGADLGCPPWW